MLYSFFNTLVKGYLKYRRNRIQDMYDDPFGLQQEVFYNLIDKLKNTEYGKSLHNGNIKTLEDFQKYIPVVDYEALFPYIDKMMQGKENILWPGKVTWFAKSSGTTNDKSKFIPITDDNLFDNHVASSWDAMSILYGNRPDARIFDGKNLLMGGSLNHVNSNLITGDVSAILLNNMPAIGRPFYTPDFETALMADWEEKIEKMARVCSKEDVVMFAGVPTWTIVLFKRILEITGKDNMCEVWPNVKTYFHGGVGFDPYVEQFKKFLPKEDIEYYEAYNASEGYFAVQDRLYEKGMLLLLDNAIFYEFIPSDQVDSPDPMTLTLQDVELDKDYCIVISTSSGLWRYKPGDMVRFVTLNPYRIMVSGRTKHYINVFGEEVMVHNTDKALRETCARCGGVIADYTVAPLYMSDASKGGHEWLIEFEEIPSDLPTFEKVLDDQLRLTNSDYDAKRHKSMALQALKIQLAPKNTFNHWLKAKGKLGGQSKIPRLSNNRKYLDELLIFINQHN
ncbi:MAG: GH3 auxin-responsive promoter family protein [Saprospiraceae bacterium]|nr:GH3 auxin-responsive promoter family protein [Saprospiraceae bacterium]MBP6567926.1 GH3 auxin-responsive promoter family protein [Saprospiraceae bacterium]